MKKIEKIANTKKIVGHTLRGGLLTTEDPFAVKLNELIEAVNQLIEARRIDNNIEK